MNSLDSISKGSHNYDFTSFIEEVYNFNEIADQARDMGPPSLDDLKNQYNIIHEEVLEIEDGLYLNDPVAVLDGVVDTLVTVLGMARQLELLGFDVLGSCKQVAFDNLTKYVRTEDMALASVNSLKAKGVEAEYLYNDYFETYVIVDSNNKIRKPINFIGTNLSSYVPSDIKGFV